MECPDSLYADAGLSSGDRAALTSAFSSVQTPIYDSVVNAGGWVFQLFSPWTFWSVCPQPLIHRGSCTRDLRSYTGGPDPGAELISFTDMAECAYNSTNPTSMPNLRQDVANFLLIRGDYTWLGAAWGGCNIHYFRVPEMDFDYGVPLGYLKEGPTGVFTRQYTHFNVSMDCNSWTPSFIPIPSN